MPKVKLYKKVRMTVEVDLPQAMTPEMAMHLVGMIEGNMRLQENPPRLVNTELLDESEMDIPDHTVSSLLRN